MNLEPLISRYYEISTQLIELREKWKYKKIEYKSLKIQLRDAPQYQHLKSKTAKDDMILLDTESKKKELVNLESEIEQLELDKEIARFHLQNLVNENNST